MQWIGMTKVQINNVLLGTTIINMEDIEKINYVGDSFLDEAVNISMLENFFEKKAYENLVIKINSTRTSLEYKCGQCNHTVETECVQCGMCLVWYHFSCSNYSNEENWFCVNCLSTRQINNN